MSSEIKTGQPEIRLASLLAPIATILIPAIIAGFVLASALLNDGINQDNDAPARAAGFLLFAILPVVYLVMALTMGAVGYTLNKYEKLTLKNLLIICGIVSIPTATIFGWSSPFGLQDQIIGLSVFFILTASSLTVGAICWWYLAVFRLNNGMPEHEETRKPKF